MTSIDDGSVPMRLVSSIPISMPTVSRSSTAALRVCGWLAAVGSPILLATWWASASSRAPGSGLITLGSLVLTGAATILAASYWAFVVHRYSHAPIMDDRGVTLIAPDFWSLRNTLLIPWPKIRTIRSERRGSAESENATMETARSVWVTMDLMDGKRTELRLLGGGAGRWAQALMDEHARRADAATLARIGEARTPGA